MFFSTQARALGRLGLEVTVVTPTPWAPWPLPHLRPKWREYARTPRRLVDDMVRVFRPRYLNVPGQPSWSRPDSRIAGAVWRVRRDWSGALLIHGHYAVTGLAAWHVARRVGIPFVLTFHGDDLNLWPQQHPERLEELRMAARQAGAVIAVSGALADLARQVTGVQALHIPLGIDHRALAAAALPRAEARRQLGLPQDRIVVLMVGYLLRDKGVRLLVDAILGLGEPYLGLFVGDGPERAYGCDRRNAARLLDYRGMQPHDVVGRYLSAADVVVLPSEHEGLPTILVEAASLGVPIIASAVGGIPDLLAGSRGALLPALSADAVAAALTAFAARRDAAAAAAERLRTHVWDVYDANRNAARLLECYRSLAPGLRVGRL